VIKKKAKTQQSKNQRRAYAQYCERKKERLHREDYHEHDAGRDAIEDEWGGHKNAY